jgi:hypothetical protein
MKIITWKQGGEIHYLFAQHIILIKEKEHPTYAGCEIIIGDLEENLKIPLSAKEVLEQLED